MFKIEVAELREQIDFLKEMDCNFQMQGEEYYLQCESEQYLDLWQILEKGGVADCAHLLAFDSSNSGARYVWHWWQHACLSRAVCLHMLAYEREKDKPYPLSLHERFFRSTGIFYKLVRQCTPSFNATDSGFRSKRDRKGKHGHSLLSLSLAELEGRGEEPYSPLIHSLYSLNKAFIWAHEHDYIKKWSNWLAEAVAALSYKEIPGLDSEEEYWTLRFRNTPHFRAEEEAQESLLRTILGTPELCRFATVN